MTFKTLLRRCAPLALAVGLALPGIALADVITMGAPGGKGLDLQGTVLNIEAGQLVYRSQTSGSEGRKPLDQIIKLKVDSEPKLSQAEEAYAAGNMAVAAQGYQQALATTQKDWVRERAVYRLVDAAAQAGNYAAAVSAYAELLKRNPTVAADNKPVIPKDKPDLVKQGIAEAVRASGDSRLRPEQRAALNSYLFDLYMAVGDIANAQRIGGNIVDNDGGASVANQAKLQFASRQYQGVLNVIEQHKAKITSPESQFDALYLVAESKHALANAANAIPPLQDAAIAYMRVVAHFGKGKDPRIADSLLKAGIIVERCNLKAEALKIYQELVEDEKFAKSPAAAQAKAGIARIKAAPKAG